MRPLLVLSFAALLAACAPQTMIVTGRTLGATGSASLAAKDHPTELTLKFVHRTYSGPWVYRHGVDQSTFDVKTASTDSGTAATTKFIAHLPWHGSEGTALLSAPDGTSLRCRFDFSEFSRAGKGICQDSTGEIYDVVVY